jgi:hypothetical protein
MNHSVHTANKGTIHLLHSGNHYDALIPQCKLSHRRQTDSLANSISSQTNNERPTNSIMDSPILKPLQQKKRKVSHENETKPTPSCYHNIAESEEETRPTRHPSPDKSEPQQNTNLQYSQPKESTVYLSNITTAGLQCPCSAPLVGKRKLPAYMIEIAQKAAAKKRLKTKTFGHASLLHYTTLTTALRHKRHQHKTQTLLSSVTSAPASKTMVTVSEALAHALGIAHKPDDSGDPAPLIHFLSDTLAATPS